MMASELEFYLFENSFREVSDRGFPAIGTQSAHAIDYHILETGYVEEIIRKIRNTMSETGIPVESSKGETGRGQHEIALEYAEALESADRHVLYKLGTKTIAAEAGKSVTFMAKYTELDAGSSCHIHCSLENAETGENSFGGGPDGTGSSLFRHFLGGLIRLSGDFFLFFAPTVNSYKRYTPGSFAPTRLAWDYDNRTASFRVVGEGSSFRIENRMPGADANPYLAYAATLAAGMYGVRHKIEPPERSGGDAYKDSHLKPLPASLEEAADRLEASDAARELFGSDVVDHYVRHARLESEAYRRVVGEWELKRYFERI
jgi:glutamine synthetase